MIRLLVFTLYFSYYFVCFLNFYYNSIFYFINLLDCNCWLSNLIILISVNKSITSMLAVSENHTKEESHVNQAANKWTMIILICILLQLHGSRGTGFIFCYITSFILSVTFIHFSLKSVKLRYLIIIFHESSICQWITTVWSWQI